MNNIARVFGMPLLNVHFDNVYLLDLPGVPLRIIEQFEENEALPALQVGPLQLGRGADSPGPHHSPDTRDKAVRILGGSKQCHVSLRLLLLFAEVQSFSVSNQKNPPGKCRNADGCQAEDKTKEGEEEEEDPPEPEHEEIALVEQVVGQDAEEIPLVVSSCVRTSVDNAANLNRNTEILFCLERRK